MMISEDNRIKDRVLAGYAEPERGVLAITPAIGARAINTVVGDCRYAGEPQTWAPGYRGHQYIGVNDVIGLALAALARRGYLKKEGKKRKSSSRGLPGYVPEPKEE